jgi:hypothetical protein
MFADRLSDSGLDALTGQHDLGPWRRSKRGNLWRTYKGWTLCVFEKGSGWYSWSIADADGPHYSNRSYRSEQQALDSLWAKVVRLEDCL